MESETLEEIRKSYLKVFPGIEPHLVGRGWRTYR